MVRKEAIEQWRTKCSRLGLVIVRALYTIMLTVMFLVVGCGYSSGSHVV